MSHSEITSENDPFLAAVLADIDAQGFLSCGKRWLLAVSGGADSMALLDAVARLQGQLNLESLHVAHLNHRLRGSESDGDAEFVMDQTGQRNLPVTVDALDVADVAQQTGESLETAARNSRYRFFAQTAKAQNCQVIAVAHNADDQAETILHRILRGTGLRGLAGMVPARPLKCDKEELQLIRPLLNLPRSEIQSYLKRHGIPYREDTSNASSQFTRNRLRNELLPQLREQINPNADEALRQLGMIAGWAQSHLATEIEGVLKTCIQKQDHVSVQLSVTAMVQLPAIQQVLVFEEALALLKAPRRRVGFKQLTNLLDLLASPQRSASIQLPGGLTACKQGETVTLQLSPAADPEIQLEPLKLQLPGNTPISEGYIACDAKTAAERAITAFQAQMISIDPAELRARYQTKPTTEEYLDFDQVNGDLILRTRQEGDRFYPLGASGDKTLGDFFTDAKVPLSCRDRQALVCDDKGIIWVSGQRLAHRARVTQATSRILKLSCHQK